MSVTESELHYIATVKSTRNSKNREFGYVYLLNCNQKIEEYVFEDEEVSEVKYVYYQDLEKMVEQKIEGLVRHDEEYEKLWACIRKKQNRKQYTDKEVFNKKLTEINQNIQAKVNQVVYDGWLADYEVVW